MKNTNASEEEIEGKLPFSFEKKEVPIEQIKAHWQKIAAKIALIKDQIEVDKKSKTEND